MRPALFSLACILACCVSLNAQDPNATVSGRVLDPSGAVVPGTQVRVINDTTNIELSTTTNDAGIYSIPSVPPGKYHIQVSKNGFKNMVKPDVILHVQDALTINFTLEIGAASESVTVEGGAPLVNTESAAVSTVVDRQFAENLPMNGRSFQTLIQLTPGVVLTTPSMEDGGQFSVNGQRPSSNYWTVDGVSANVGATATNLPGNGSAGALPSLSAFGGTNSLVSVDALQEFRILTSTYAPEFGRVPGGQISIVTRSGTNQFHGTAFDYLRNDLFDADDWFANSKGLAKPREHQNDFGGVLGGPIIRDKTFFFFSYEGLRLRLPQVALTGVPDLSARQNAIAAVQPFLNAFPQPNGPDNLTTGVAQFNSSFSNPATLDAYSVRIDQKLTGKLTLFGRYNYSPSENSQRGIYALSTVVHSDINTYTATLGATWSASPSIANDLRFNYSRTHAAGNRTQDKFGGAVPVASLPFPSPFTTQNAQFGFGIGSLGNHPTYFVGLYADNLQRQINLVDNLSVQKGRHGLKFGVDFRRLSPVFDPSEYLQQIQFGSVASAGAGNVSFSVVRAEKTSSLLFHNLGVFAQDIWRIAPRLTVTYGLRWDVDFAPSSASGPSLLAVTGYNLNDLSNLALAPAGTPPFKTTYGNVAPRVGIAYQLSQRPDWQTVIRGGGGVFYDLASSQVGNMVADSYPFGAALGCISFFQLPGCPSSLTFPLDPSTAAPPPITVASLMQGITLFASDPNLKLPYTLQWNFAFEQGMGREQTLSASYIGAIGRRLLQSAVLTTSPTFPVVDLVGNTGTSDYGALQLQFQRRVSHGLQALVSYSWSHSIDTGSAGSSFNQANTLVPGANPNANRGPSDFDIRHTFSGGLTYDLPAPEINAFTNAILHGWSLQSFILARSAPPEDILYNNLFFPSAIRGAYTNVRPDVFPGIPLYLFGSQFPGGKAFNNTLGAVSGGCPDGSTSVGPFCPPPSDPMTGLPLRQGNLGRNRLRGFGATQWDFAVHRDFLIRESLRLQFRAEMFNVLNHPNFGPPNPFLDQGVFGVATQMLGQSLSGGGVGGGGFNPLYQIGGPRSVQFALKAMF